MKRRFCLPLAATLFLCAAHLASAQWTTTNIAYAKRDVAPQDFFADDIGAYYEVRGRVTSPHFSTNRTEFFIQDTNDNVGIHVYAGSFVASAAMYTEVNVLGALAQSNGLRMLLCTYPEDITVTDPTPVEVPPVPGTIADLLSNGELYEGTYVVISNLTLTDPANWPDWKDNANLSVTDLTGRITVRVDVDLDIDGQLAPTNVFHVRGIFSQFDSSLNPTGGYQILPRAYTDFELATDNEPPEIFIVNSNTFSVVAGATLTVNMLAHDRNATDVLIISTNDAPDGAVVTNLPDREALFTWTPDVGYAGTTNKIVFEITDGLLTNTTAIDVFVLSEELGNIKLNEVLWDPANSVLYGDASGDGVRNETTDEFVEIVNDNATPVDITGWELKFGTNTFFTFPATVLTGKTAVVVFGGGTPVGTFGHSIVYAPLTNWAGLANSPAGRTVSLWTDGGAQLFSYDYALFGTPDMSATRNPDFTGDFVLHTGVVSFLRWSPGTMGNGKFFAGTGITNTAPLIEPIGNRSVGTGQGILIPFTALDPESNPIVLTASNMPASASFVDNGNGTATLAYTGLVSHANSNFIVSVYANDGISPASSRSFTLNVLDGTYAGLIINEYLVAPRDFYDANNDGTIDASQDEFIEIVNTTTGTIDLAGCMIYDNSSMRHRFTSVVVPTGGAVVVFGGGNLDSFEYPPAQIASSGALGLNNYINTDIETIILYSPQTNELDRQEYTGGEWSYDASQTRYPDITGGWTNHYIVTGGALRGSPGRRVDGSLFLPYLPNLSITNPASSSVVVSNSVSTYTIQGTANSNVTGQLVWTNDLTGGAGTAAAGTNWSIAGVALDVGINTITVKGTNGVGNSIERSVTITRQSASGTLLWFQGFEGGAGDTWTFTGTGAADALAVRSGTLGWRFGGTQSITLTNVSVEGYTSLLLSIHDAAGEGLVGIENNDRLEVYVSLDGAGFPATPDIWIGEGITNDSSYNKTWDYSASGLATTTAGTPLRFHGDGASGYATIEISIPDGTTNISVQIKSANNSGTEYYHIDDISLTGTGGGGSGDEDGDGIPDDYENTWFGGPTNAIAGDDDDDDGFSNLEEYVADTIPVNPLGSNSFFEIERLTNSSARFIQFLSSTGRLYTFQTTADLQNGNSWSNLEEDVQGEGGTMRFDDPAIAPRRHYRLRVRVP